MNKKEFKNKMVNFEDKDTNEIDSFFKENQRIYAIMDLIILFIGVLIIIGGLIAYLLLK